MSLTDTEIHEKAKKLSEEKRDFLFSGDFSNRVNDIADENGITVSVDVSTLAGIYAELVLDEIPKNRLRAEAQERLNLPEGKAMAIADALQKEPFKISASPEKKPLTPPTKKVSPLPKLEIKAGPPKPTTLGSTTDEKPIPTIKTLPKKPVPQKAPTPVTPVADAKQRPSVPLPEDALLKNSPTPATSPPPPKPKPLTAKPPTPTGKASDSYKETIESKDMPPKKSAVEPVPEKPAEERENLGPLIDGNIIDLRE